MNRWEERAKTSREDLRWSRTVEAEVEGGGGGDTGEDPTTG